MARTGNNSRIPAIGTYGGAPTFAADLTEVASNVADLIDPSVATVGALPSSGNWYGRTMRVSADNGEYVWLGSGWVRSRTTPWTAYVPTWANHTMGSGTVAARWRYVGNEVQFAVARTIGIGGVLNANTTFSLPAAISSSLSGLEAIGDGSVTINGVTYPLTTIALSSTTAYGFARKTSAAYESLDGVTTAGVPAAAVSGTEVYVFKGRYLA